MLHNLGPHLGVRNLGATALLAPVQAFHLSLCFWVSSLPTGRDRASGQASTSRLFGVKVRAAECRSSLSSLSRRTANKLMSPAGLEDGQVLVSGFNRMLSGSCRAVPKPKTPEQLELHGCLDVGSLIRVQRPRLVVREAIFSWPLHLRVVVSVVLPAPATEARKHLKGVSDEELVTGGLPLGHLPSGAHLRT